MEATFIKIANVSQELYKVVSEASARSGGVRGPDVSRAQFWLDKIMITSKEILIKLNQHTIAGSGSPLDEHLEDWISAEGPVICLATLNEMKKIICMNRPCSSSEKTLFGFMSSLVGHNDTTPKTTRFMRLSRSSMIAGHISITCSCQAHGERPGCVNKLRLIVALLIRNLGTMKDALDQPRASAASAALQNNSSASCLSYQDGQLEEQVQRTVQ